LSYAAKKGRQAVVKLPLPKKGVDVNSKNTKHGRMPLSWAAENWHEAVVKHDAKFGRSAPREAHQR
jgi:hypothetical protein